MEIKTADLKAAEDGSWYTISGAGGDLADWVEGYGKLLAEAGITRPTEWFKATGAEVNAAAGDVADEQRFPDDVTFLLFPLDGMEVGKLAMFKIAMQDRWFDDVVQNMRGF